MHNITLYVANAFDAPYVECNALEVSCYVVLMMIAGGNFAADYRKKWSFHNT